MNTLRLELAVGPDHPLAGVSAPSAITMTLCGERFEAQLVYIGSKPMRITQRREVVLHIPDTEGRLAALLRLDAA